jgi:hypothetical protein
MLDDDAINIIYHLFMRYHGLVRPNASHHLHYHYYHHSHRLSLLTVLLLVAALGRSSSCHGEYANGCTLLILVIAATALAVEKSASVAVAKKKLINPR